MIAAMEIVRGLEVVGKKRRNPPQRKKKNINLWIDAAIKAELDEMSNKSKPKTTRTAIIALAVEEYLERLKGK